MSASQDVPPAGADVGDRWTLLRQRLRTLLGESGQGAVSSPLESNSLVSVEPTDGEFAVRWHQALCLLPGYDAALATTQAPYGLLARLAGQLRERFAPYRYAVNALHRDYGWPVVYPPGDANTAENADVLFLIGNALLVAPVLGAGITRRGVPLPAGRWYDYWSDVAYEGGQSVAARAPLERLPLFVRGGTALPLRAFAPGRPALCLRVYMGDDESALYEDGGSATDYEQGNYRWGYVTCQTQPGQLTITRRVAGRYVPPYSSFTLEVVGLSGPPFEVLADRRNAPIWFFEHGRLELVLPDDVSKVEITG